MTDRRLGSMVLEDTGDGPSVVLIHGLGGTSNSFEPLMPALAGYRVVRPDLPGSGRSGFRPGIDSIAALARTVTDALRAIGVSSAILIGHSMGTLLCQHMAVKAPERVSSMILFGAILEPPSAARASLLDRARSVQANGMADVASTIASGSVKAESPVSHAFVRESLIRQSPEGYAAQCRALASAKALPHDRITCPVTLVTGREDPVAPPAMAEQLQQSLPNADLTLLPNTGHWPMIEAPHACREVIAQAIAP